MNRLTRRILIIAIVCGMGAFPCLYYTNTAWAAVDVVKVASTDQATFTAGAALPGGTVVYIKASDGEAYAADADLGIAAYGVVVAGANVTIANGALVSIATKGTLIGESGLTVNGAVYLSQTAGSYTQTVGVDAFLQPIGIARSSTVIDFNIEPSYTPTTRLPNTIWEVVYEFNGSFSASSYFATNKDWVLTTTEGGGGDATETIGDADFGILTMLNDAADNDLDSAQSKFEYISLTASKRTMFEIRFQLNEATENDVAIGLAVRDTTPITSPTDTVYFLKSDDATDWDFVSTSASNAVTVSAVDTADTSFHVFSFVCDGITSCTPYIDGVVNTSITSASAIPATNMTATVHIQNGEAVAKSIAVDYIRVSQER